MVPADGLEPPTLCSEDRCSNPLSYAGTLLLPYFNREGDLSLPMFMFGELNSSIGVKANARKTMALKDFLGWCIGLVYRRVKMRQILSFSLLKSKLEKL